MRLLKKKIADWFIKPYLLLRLRFVSYWKYDGLQIQVNPGVFHPKYFFSTRYLLSYLEGFNLSGKSFCEPGAGSGVISLWACLHFARVTAFDISSAAVENIKLNFIWNEGILPKENNFTVFESNLFDKVPPQLFEYIVINPPYFFKEAKNDAEEAWCCGKNGEYFNKLFYQLPEYSNENTNIFMILAENCEIERIKNIANAFNYGLELMVSKKIRWEWNYIFKLTSLKSNNAGTERANISHK